MAERYVHGTFSDDDLHAYREFMVEFLDRAKKESRAFWDNPTKEITKEDASPVTELDRRLEEQFRESVAKKFPEHGVIGEEYGNSNLAAEIQWIVDPIDGTMNLVNRVPTFGTLLALSYKGYPVLGAIDHPIMDIRFTGGEQVGVFDISGQKLAPFAPTDRTLSNAPIGAAAPGTFNRIGAVSLLEKLVGKIPNLRIYYDCFASAMTVSGGIYSNIDCGLRIWDVAAAMALVRGRGGVVYEFGVPWSGDPKDRVSMVFGQKGISKSLFDCACELYPQINA